MAASKQARRQQAAGRQAPMGVPAQETLSSGAGSPRARWTSAPTAPNRFRLVGGEGGGQGAAGQGPLSRCAAWPCAACGPCQQRRRQQRGSGRSGGRSSGRPLQGPAPTNEDDGRLQARGDPEQRPHQLLRVAVPPAIQYETARVRGGRLGAAGGRAAALHRPAAGLGTSAHERAGRRQRQQARWQQARRHAPAGERCRRNVEKSGPSLMRQRPRQQRLAVACAAGARGWLGRSALRPPVAPGAPSHLAAAAAPQQRAAAAAAHRAGRRAAAPGRGLAAPGTGQPARSAE